MPARWKYVAGTLALLVLTYSLLITAEVLLGVIVAVQLYGTAWLFATFSPEEGYAEALGWPRIAVLTLIGATLLTYSLVIANQILLGVVAVCLVTFVGFLSAPGGPLTRVVEFYRAILRIDRHLQEQEGELTDGGRDDAVSTDENGTGLGEETGWERDHDD